MQLPKTIRTLLRKALDLSDLNLQNVVGWRSIGGATYHHYKENDQENGYASIKVIANNFAKIEPYAIDKTAKMVPSNVLDRLYTPNNQMSAYDFREALAVMSLVHSKVRIRVHYRTTRLTAETITGFTFLEDVFEQIVDGQRQYRLPNGEQLTDSEVITLKDINAYNLDDGFSPAQAARRWTKLDDYIADYQAGFFENGAIPAGQMIITARTVTEYNDIVDTIEARHKGAGKNNNITFAHRPTDATGSPLNSQVEWIPFSSQNKDMALKDLFENVNKKIDSAYGVPASLRGVNDQNTYASVRTDEVVFIKYRLDPFVMKIWSKFTHELNRITGGMGMAITYKLEIPQIADEEKVIEEAKEIKARTITSLTTSGYSLDSAIAYVKDGDASVLKQLPKVEEKPETLTAEEAKDTPDQPIDAFSKSPQSLKAKVLSEVDRQDYETQLADVIRNRMTVQVNKVIRQYDGISKAITLEDPIDESEDQTLTTEMFVVLSAALLAQGAIEHANNTEIVLEAGINTDDITPFVMTPEQRIEYEAYLRKVATGYNQQTADKIRNIIEAGRINQLTATEIKDQLSEILAEEWRIQRIAVTEVNNAGNKSSLDSMKQIADETGALIDKVWTHGGGDSPCAYCQALIGQTTGLDQDFVELDQHVTGTDGSVYINDFDAKDSGGLHPNCHCRATYRVRS